MRCKHGDFTDWVKHHESPTEAEQCVEITNLHAEVEKLRQAVGLATTAVPTMEINVKDPIGMMHKVVNICHKYRDAKTLVDNQAEDDGLWSVPANSAEMYFQQALRRLHVAIEGKSQRECARDALERIGIKVD